jgi:hypothetical protein
MVVWKYDKESVMGNVLDKLIGIYSQFMNGVLVHHFCDTHSPLVFDNGQGSEKELYFVNGRKNNPIVYDVDKKTLILISGQRWEEYCEDYMLSQYLKNQTMSVSYYPSGFQVSIGTEERSICFNANEFPQVNFEETVQLLRTEYANHLYHEMINSGIYDDKSDEELREQADEKAPLVIFPGYKG